MAQAEIKAIITADDRASKVLSGVGDSFSKLLKITAVGATVAAGAAVAFGVSAVKSFMESEDAAAQLNATLKSTGGVAGVTAEQADHLASSLQKVTKFSDETILGGENLLLTFTKIGKDIFPQATEVMLDMSTALGQDVKSSAIQLGKALQDPILGVTALRRVGVNFNSAQQEVIKNLVETGRAGEAQALILKELQVEFGGSAKAAGETFAGKLEILKNQFDDVKESIGKTLVEALSPLMKQLADFVASDKFQAWLKELNVWLTTQIPIAIAWLKDEGIPALKGAFDLLWPVVKTLIGWLTDLVNFLVDHEFVFWAIVGVFGAIKTAMLLEGALTAFKSVISGASLLYKGLQLLLATPLSLTLTLLGVAAVIAGFVVVMNKWKETSDTINNTRNAIADMGSSNEIVIGRLNALLRGTKAEAERAQTALLGLGVSQRDVNAQLGLKGGFASGGYTGRGGTNEVAGVVHRGEYVLPKTAVDQTTGMPKVQMGGGGGGSNINITFSGIFTGNEMEFRKLATKVFQAAGDVAGMQNNDITAMTTQNWRRV